LALILAACGGAPEPTATPLPPTQTPIPSATPEPTATLAPNVIQARTLEVPPAGTLIITPLGNTQTPPPPFTFDIVYFNMMGGSTGVTLEISIDSEGNVTRSNTTSTTTPEVVESIRAALAAINFFGMQGQFDGSAPADAYRYAIRVEGSQGSRGFSATQGYIPPELQNVFDLLLALGI
jgi:hypothetical protein